MPKPDSTPVDDDAAEFAVAEDAEGHKHRFKGVRPAENDEDAEGHKHRFKG